MITPVEGITILQIKKLMLREVKVLFKFILLGSWRARPLTQGF